MLSKSLIEKYADVMIWALQAARTRPFKKYDTILLRFEQLALPLAEALHRKLLQRRWQVIPRGLMSDVMEQDFYNHTDSRQRKNVASWEKQFLQSVNGSIFLSAPSSLTHLKEVDPKRMNEAAVARRSLRQIMERREERGLFSWTLCSYPAPEPARRAGLTDREYEAQIVRACFLKEPDPVKKWKEIYAGSREIKEWLNGLRIESFHLESRSCDLYITLGDKRRFLGLSGHNIPSFEIFTSPDWRGTRGIYGANLPSYRSGNYVKGVRLEFKNGVITRSSAAQGDAFLRRMIAMDAGAKRIGEFSLTDKRFSRISTFMADTLFDENFGGGHGNCHIAVGNSYSDTFAGNPARLTAAARKNLGLNESALHWDLVNTEEKTVTATLRGGKKITLYDKGMFKM